MILATDVDGTLIERGHVLTSENAHAIAALVRKGWVFAAITGQNVFDIEKRLTTSLSEVGVNSFTVYTCEGARRWMFRAGHPALDQRYERGQLFQKQDRRELDRALFEFVRGTGKAEYGRFEFAGWWEEAIFVLKLRDPAAADRREITAELYMLLSQRLRPDLMDMVEIRIAGRTTVILTRRSVNKAMALQDLRNRWHWAEILYIGDEFGPFGNDAPTIGIPGVQLVSVGEVPTTRGDRVTWMGGGPPATFRLIRKFAYSGLLPTHHLKGGGSEHEGGEAESYRSGS